MLFLLSPAPLAASSLPVLLNGDSLDVSSVLILLAGVPLMALSVGILFGGVRGVRSTEERGEDSAVESGK
jgi:hypothetical protein